jgi:hypothetical protein
LKKILNSGSLVYHITSTPSSWAFRVLIIATKDAILWKTLLNTSPPCPHNGHGFYNFLPPEMPTTSLRLSKLSFKAWINFHFLLENEFLLS